MKEMMNWKAYHYIVTLTVLIFVQYGCAQPADQAALPSDPDFPYDLDKPTKTMKLPYDLNEISGLSLGPDQESLVAVQDEKGWIFFLDKSTGAIKKRTTFAKDGDYEGIEYVDGAFWIVKSGGKLYKKKFDPQRDKETEKYDTDIDDIRNIEGLGYDPVSNQLLLACKGPNSSKKSDAFQREILAFDMDDKKMKKSPAITVTRENIHAFLHSKGWKEADDFFSKLVKKLYDEFSFQPSGIGVHPETKDFYIISFTAHLLMVLDRNHEIKHIVKIPKSVLYQPEGIVIDTNGDLYISSEGKRGTAKIAVFSPKI